MLVSLARQLESEAQNAIHAPPREYGLLDSHLVIGAFIEASANVRVFPLIVLANDGEIDLTRLPVLQGRVDSVEKAYRAKIDVLPESAPDGNQKPPKRDVVGGAGLANRAEENGVERPQLLEAVVRHHFPGVHIGCAAPVKRLPMQAKTKTLRRCSAHANTCRDSFFSDDT